MSTRWKVPWEPLAVAVFHCCGSRSQPGPRYGMGDLVIVAKTARTTRDKARKSYEPFFLSTISSSTGTPSALQASNWRTFALPPARRGPDRRRGGRRFVKHILHESGRQIGKNGVPARPSRNGPELDLRGQHACLPSNRSNRTWEY